MHLVEKGSKDLLWLDKLSVTNRVIPVMRRGNQKASKGIIRVPPPSSDANTGSRIFLSVIFQDGTEDRVTFNELMHYQYSSVVRKRKGHGIKEWPMAVESKQRGPESEEEAEEKEEKEEEVNKRPRKKRKKAKKYVYDPEEWKIDTKEEEEIVEKPELSEMFPSLAHSLWRNFNSAEPSVFANLILSNSVFNRQGLNTKLGNNFVELLLDGPMSEGDVFPDPHRVECAFQVFVELRKRPEFMRNCVNKCFPKTWPDFQDFIDRMSKQSYTPVLDAQNSSEINYERIADSLHLSGRAANFLADMVESAFVGSHTNGKVVATSEERGEISLKNIMLLNEKGVRDSTKAVISLFTNSWHEHGHFVVNDSNGVDEAKWQRCRETAQLYLHHLARIARWALFSFSSGSSSTDTVCVQLLAKSSRDHVLSESSKISEVLLLRLRLEMITGLGLGSNHLMKEFIESVQNGLARQLGVCEEYSLLV